MRFGLIGLVLLCLVWPAHGQWRFDAPIDIARGKVFHHLDAAGRKSLAVSGTQVALAWEDDRDGTPRCYLALKEAGAQRFKESALDAGECYAPAIAALDDDRFAAIWEGETGVQAALVDAQGLAAPITLARQGGQGTLAWHPEQGLVAAWSQPEGRWRRVWLARLDVVGRALRARQAQPVDPAPPSDDQIYPALASGARGHVLTWEDRRRGHTVVYASQATGLTWSAPSRVSQNPSGKVADNLGRGTGAMRPAIAAFGADGMAIAWLDKRDFLSGYDVYAAVSDKAGAGFGANRKVQDSFGDAIAQWHAAIAGNRRGQLVIAWDDDRDGTPDIWLSWPTATGFSDNLAASPAAGPGAQTDPVLDLDGAGNLHLAWVERDDTGESRLRYSLGRPEKP